MEAEALRIPLHNRDGEVVAHALVDVCDGCLAAFRWSPNGDGYAVRFIQVPGAGQRAVMLHRTVLGLEYGDGQQTDHVNGDRLDCRRGNLRVATHAENAQNLPPRVGCTSGFRGVARCSRSGRWKAYATVGGKTHWLGRFDSEAGAAEVARAFRAAHMPFANEARVAA